MATVPITDQLNLGTDGIAARSWVLHELGPVLAKAGYKATATSLDNVTFTRRYLPTWALVVGVLTLPLGLVLLALVRSTSTLVVDLGEVRDGYVLAAVVGDGPKKVRDLFAKLNREGVSMPQSSQPIRSS